MDKIQQVYMMTITYITTQHDLWRLLQRKAVRTFKHLDGDSGLVVCRCGEDLGLLGGDDGVTRDQLGHDTTDGLDTHGQGVDIKKYKVTYGEAHTNRELSEIEHLTG